MNILGAFNRSRRRDDGKIHLKTFNGGRERHAVFALTVTVETGQRCHLDFEWETEVENDGWGWALKNRVRNTAVVTVWKTAKRYEGQRFHVSQDNPQESVNEMVTAIPGLGLGTVLTIMAHLRTMAAFDDTMVDAINNKHRQTFPLIPEERRV